MCVCVGGLVLVDFDEIYMCVCGGYMQNMVPRANNVKSYTSDAQNTIEKSKWNSKTCLVSHRRAGASKQRNKTRKNQKHETESEINNNKNAAPHIRNEKKKSAFVKPVGYCSLNE